MSDRFVKITIGFVHQTFEKDARGRFICIDQVFIAGDDCDYENSDGEPLRGVPAYVYQPYEMVAPQVAQPPVKYLLFNDVLGSLANPEPIAADSLEAALAEILRSMGYSVIEAERCEEEL